MTQEQEAKNVWGDGFKQGFKHGFTVGLVLAMFLFFIGGKLL